MQVADSTLLQLADTLHAFSHLATPLACAQVLLSQIHRLRALVLLARFLDMGPWATDLALSTGIYPYVLKLLQTTAAELRPILVFIWAKILASDPSCQVLLQPDVRELEGLVASAQRCGTVHSTLRCAACKLLAPRGPVTGIRQLSSTLQPCSSVQPCWSPSACCHGVQTDLVRDEGHLYFIRFLEAPDEGTTAETRAQAAFVLATVCVGVPGPGLSPWQCDPAHQVLLSAVCACSETAAGNTLAMRAAGLEESL